MLFKLVVVIYLVSKLNAEPTFDIVAVIDQEYYVRGYAADWMWKQIEYSYSGQKIGQDKHRMGLVFCHELKPISLQDGQKEKLVAELKRRDFKDIFSDNFEKLKPCFELAYDMFTEANGDREGSTNNFIVVVSDGQWDSDVISKIKGSFARLREKGTTLLISIHDLKELDIHYLDDLYSDSKWYSTYFENLKNLFPKLYNESVYHSYIIYHQGAKGPFILDQLITYYENKTPECGKDKRAGQHCQWTNNECIRNYQLIPRSSGCGRIINSTELCDNSTLCGEKPTTESSRLNGKENDDDLSAEKEKENKQKEKAAGLSWSMIAFVIVMTLVFCALVIVIAVLYKRKMRKRHLHRKAKLAKQIDNSLRKIESNFGPSQVRNKTIASDIKDGSQVSSKLVSLKAKVKKGKNKAQKY